MDIKNAQAIANAFHYLREAEEEIRDLKSFSVSEMRHLLGHVWYEINSLQKTVAPEWTIGTGEDLPLDSWAYVVHPSFGVMWAHLGMYIESAPDGVETKCLTWTDYQKGESVNASEVTHYIPVDVSPPLAPDVMARAYYGGVWDTLVLHVGANPEGKADFVRKMTDPKSRVQEYRFFGEFGYGGKIYRDRGRMHISCYPEDLNPHRQEVINRVNRILEDLRPGVVAGNAEACNQVGGREDPTTP